MRVPAVAFIALVTIAVGASTAQAVEEFGTDPQWGAVGNQTVITSRRANQFDFIPNAGIAGMQNPVVGGMFTRSPVYADIAYVPPTSYTLETNPFPSASGLLAVGTTITADSGVWLGWHSTQSRSERPNDSLGVRLDSTSAAGGCGSSSDGARILLALTTSGWATKRSADFYRRQPPPGHPPSDGSYVVLCPGITYRWYLQYSPVRSVAFPQGYMEFGIDGAGQPLRIALPANIRGGGATFNRFGLWAPMTTSAAGTAMDAYIDDVRINNTYVCCDTTTSNWVANGNRPFDDPQTVRTDVIVPGGLGPGGVGPCRVDNARGQSFGYAPGTNFAKGAHPGEMGGLITRRDSSLPNDKCAADLPRSPGEFSYGKRLAQLPFNREFIAQGKLNVLAADSDATAIVGWYSAGKLGSSDDGLPPATLGFEIDNLADYALYATPIFKSDLRVGVVPTNVKADPRSSPLVARGRAYDFFLHYVPAGSGGTLTLTLNDGFTFPRPEISVAVPAPAVPTSFDHFGLRGYDLGGGPMRIFLDDLSFTQ